MKDDNAPAIMQPSTTPKVQDDDAQTSAMKALLLKAATQQRIRSQTKPAPFKPLPTIPRRTPTSSKQTSEQTLATPDQNLANRQLKKLVPIITTDLPKNDPPTTALAQQTLPKQASHQPITKNVTPTKAIHIARNNPWSRSPTNQISVPGIPTVRVKETITPIKTVQQPHIATTTTPARPAVRENSSIQLTVTEKIDNKKPLPRVVPNSLGAHTHKPDEITSQLANTPTHAEPPKPNVNATKPVAEKPKLVEETPKLIEEPLETIEETPKPVEETPKPVATHEHHATAAVNLESQVIAMVNENDSGLTIQQFITGLDADRKAMAILLKKLLKEEKIEKMLTKYYPATSF